MNIFVLDLVSVQDTNRRKDAEASLFEAVHLPEFVSLRFHVSYLFIFLNVNKSESIFSVFTCMFNIFRT